MHYRFFFRHCSPSFDTYCPMAKAMFPVECIKGIKKKKVVECTAQGLCAPKPKKTM